MTEKISVYGSTGFIGGTFCRMFPDDIIRIPREKLESQSKNVLYFISTTTNQNVFKDLNVDIDTNLSLFVDFLNECKGKDVTINFISSCFVYGNDVIDAKETDCCNPTGFYSITKRCAEQLLISFCKTFDINYRILRIGNVYGLDKTISPGKNVLGYMINLLKENKDITLYNGGNFLKDYIYVEDVCEAIKLILKVGNDKEICNIGTGVSFSFSEIMNKAKDIVGSKSNILSVEMPKDQEYIQIKNMTLNVDKIKEMGFSPKLHIMDGLQKLCNVVQ